MKIILLGANGNMGKEIQDAAMKDNSCEIVCRVDLTQNHNTSIIDDINLFNDDADIIIDFSTSKDRKSFIKYSKDKNLPYACFSTNISSEDEKLLLDLSKHLPVLICQNASRGINLIYEMIELACQKISQADVALCEYHHKNKKDSPSGTAKKIEGILNSYNMNFQTNSFRVGNEKGFHKISFYLEDEIIEISHQTFSRKIFAFGALKMCEKLIQQNKGIYYNL